MKITKHIQLFFFVAVSLQLIAFSCSTIDLYEKNVPIPGHEWESSFKPEFTFIIKDTTSSYQVFFIIRHSEKYNYNNVWINLFSQPPGDTIHKVSYELQLATNEKGWLASGLDDIYEHRIRLTDEIKLKTGEYKLRLENIMREDPLMNVMSVGLRVEKKL